MNRSNIIAKALLVSFLLFLGGIPVFPQNIYWENPEILERDNVWFPLAASSDSISLVMWQEFSDSQNGQSSLTVSMLVTEDGKNWSLHKNILGPFEFTGDKVSVTSVIADARSNIYIAVSDPEKGILIYASFDRGESFELIGTPGGEGVTTVAPRIFRTGTGGFILFVTRSQNDSSTLSGRENALGISYSVSFDGITWSDYRPIVTGGMLANIYLPYHASLGGKEHVVFQASSPDSRFYQLYHIQSSDGGRTWSSPVLLTGFSEEGQSSVNYDNQRAFLTVNGNRLYLAWERRLGSSISYSYFGELDTVSRSISSYSRVEGTGISTNPVNNPQIYFREGQPVVLWYNNIGQTVLAVRDNSEWFSIDFPGQSVSGLSNFCRFLDIQGEMNIIWQNDSQGRLGLVRLAPDRTVPGISITPVSFGSAPSRSDIYTVTWNLPSDSSGIAGFSYSLDRNPEGASPKTIMVRRRDDRRVTFNVDSDGAWYIHLRAVDYAGNWSEVSTVSFTRDTTPPGSVTINDPETDDSGYLVSNTGVVRWDPPEGEEAAGYSFRMQYLGQSDYRGPLDAFSVAPTPGRASQRNTEYRFYNQDNGLWAFTVTAFDSVGNKSSPETIFLRLNKYIPVTYITGVTAEQDDLGKITMRIQGRGFSVGGDLTNVILDRDKEEPFDYVYDQDNSYFNIVTDRVLDGLEIEDMEEGSYYLGLIHPERGLYFSNERLTFESTGTVKFGNFSILEKERQPRLILRKLTTLSVNRIFFGVVLLLLGLMTVFAFTRIIATVREGAEMRMEVRALLNNNELPSEKRMERIKNMKKRGMGLRIKFALMVTLLVLLVVIMVSYPLGVFIINTQQRNLTDGLSQTTEVLINSVTTAAAKYLQENNTLELRRLPDLIESMNDARFLTITGPGTGADGRDLPEYLWATNDGNIRDKVDLSGYESETEIEGALPGGALYTEGTLGMRDGLSQTITELSGRINSQGAESVGVLSRELNRLQGIASEMSRKARTEADIEEIRKMQDEISMISREIDNKLSEISNYFGSVPDFDPEKILTNPTEYTFYKPIVYQQRNNTEKFYQGTVRLQISTDHIISEIEASRDNLVKRTIYIALAAIGLGIVGALVLASFIIRPINHLLRKVEEIRDTEDHLELKNFNVDIKTRDEIYHLADMVNQMTKGLYKAAQAREELTVGKDVQKQFLPLLKNERGEKLSTAMKETGYADFFGYYEGAKGVSGDYFDFMEIDTDRFAVIKCDISGKGVSASLIMAEVATIFHSYFNDWIKENDRKKAIAAAKKIKLKASDPQIDQLVYSINGLVESMGFKGRFAALIIAYIDTVSGKTTFCNAGDNQVHIYKQASGRMEIITLPSSPAAGVFSNDMVESTSGFKLVPYQMDHGDILLLFTDGIEEAQRHFRNRELKIFTCQDETHESSPEATHKKDQDFEEFGIPRMHQIVQAVINRGKYDLYKFHNEDHEESFTFDFSSCEGTFIEAITALLSIERVFRLYSDPSAGSNDRIVVDDRISEFLADHFNEYDLYFGNKVDKKEESHYIGYTHLKEDEQFDDLTVLGIRRK